PARSRDGRVIRRALIQSDSQKPPQPERIRRPPGNAALRIDPLEIAQQQQAEIHSRRQRGPAVVGGVEYRALLLYKLIELLAVEEFIEALIKRMRRTLSQLVVSDPKIFLPLAVLASAHRPNQSSKPCGGEALLYGRFRFGTDLMLTLPVTFTSTYTGANNVYSYAAGSSANSGWQTLGTWTVPVAVNAVSVFPTSGSGLQHSFTPHYSDGPGATAP